MTDHTNRVCAIHEVYCPEGVCPWCEPKAPPLLPSIAEMAARIVAASPPSASALCGNQNVQFTCQLFRGHPGEHRGTLGGLTCGWF
jgi:hypothetical protein